MSGKPRLPPDATGDQSLLSHTPCLRISFWTLWEHVWADAATRDLKELIRYRTALYGDCFA